MTAAIGGKVAKKAAPKATAKKLAATRPANPAPKKSIASQLPSGPDQKSAPKKKLSTRVVKSKPVRAAKKANQLSFDSKFAPRLKPQKSVVSSRHFLAFMFWVGLILILTKPLGKDETEDKPTQTLVQAAAFIFMMMILFAITGMGRSAARLAAAFGGLVVLTLLLFQVNVKDRFAAITTPKEDKANK